MSLMSVMPRPFHQNSSIQLLVSVISTQHEGDGTLITTRKDLGHRHLSSFLKLSTLTLIGNLSRGISLLSNGDLAILSLLYLLVSTKFPCESPASHVLPARRSIRYCGESWRAERAYRQAGPANCPVLTSWWPHHSHSHL